MSLKMPERFLLITWVIWVYDTGWINFNFKRHSSWWENQLVFKVKYVNTRGLGSKCLFTECARIVLSSLYLLWLIVTQSTSFLIDFIYWHVNQQDFLKKHHKNSFYWGAAPWWSTISGISGLAEQLLEFLQLEKFLWIFRIEVVWVSEFSNDSLVMW